MNSKIITILLAAMAMWHIPVAYGQQQVDTDAESDQTVRLNPELGPDWWSQGSRNYSFINNAANTINMNGDNWSALRAKFDAVNEGAPVVFLTIGDSHIQAEGGTSQTRMHISQRFGSAGRGLVIPFRLAGTNQPLDYKITASQAFTTSKLLKKPWSAGMGFTGIAVRLPEGSVTFTITNKEPISAFDILGRGTIDVLSVTDAENGHNISFRKEATATGVDVKLNNTTSSGLKVVLNTHHATLYGFNLKGEGKGVIFSAIGNNGAAYLNYSSIDNFGTGVAGLHPDLVILAMGTNEAFGKISNQEFYGQIHALVNEIRTSNPNVHFLLVTPSEVQRSTYTNVVSGKRNRRRRRKVRGYAVNANVERMRDVILQYGRENNIPTYDFYQVAGGKGSSDKWLKEKLLSSDRIHRTWAGYRLDGDLMYQALMRALGFEPMGAEATAVAITPSPTANQPVAATPKPSTKKPAVKKPSSKKKKRKAKSRKKRR